MHRNDAMLGNVVHGRTLISLALLLTALLAALGLSAQVASAAPLASPGATAPTPAASAVQPAQLGVYFGVGPYGRYDDGYRPYRYSYPYYRTYGYGPEWRYRYYDHRYGSARRNPFYEYRHGIRRQPSPN